MSELVRATNAAIGSCPESQLPPSPTPSPAPTSIPPATGPEITLLGLATADDRPLEPDATDDQGHPIFERPYGQGLTIIVEARGAPGRQIGRNTYSPPSVLPDLQVLAEIVVRVSPP